MNKYLEKIIKYYIIIDRMLKQDISYDIIIVDLESFYKRKYKDMETVLENARKETDVQSKFILIPELFVWLIGEEYSSYMPHLWYINRNRITQNVIQIKKLLEDEK